MLPQSLSFRRSRRVLCGLTLLPLLAAPGLALDDVRSAFPGIPWLQRIVREGISLQVDLQPLAGRDDGELRARDRVAVRLRLADVATGQPLEDLGPVAWLGPAPQGWGVDPERCSAEAGEIVANGSPEPLRETTRPGTYETVTRFDRPGRYELVFFVGSPRLVHCFQIEVQPRGKG
jgi:hypothetical protein